MPREPANLPMLPPEPQAIFDSIEREKPITFTSIEDANCMRAESNEPLRRNPDASKSEFR